MQGDYAFEILGWTQKKSVFSLIYRQEHGGFSSESSMSAWLTGILQAVLGQYTSNVTDVLNNVTKVINEK